MFRALFIPMCALNKVKGMKLNMEKSFEDKIKELEDIVKELVTSMGKQYIPQTYIKKQYNKFYGASYSKAGMNLEPDTLTYLYNKDMGNISVTHLEYGRKNMYDIRNSIIFYCVPHF